MARNAQSVARDFGTYAIETIKREIMRNRDCYLGACERYGISSSPKGEDFARHFFENSSIEVTDDGEIHFIPPRVKSSPKRSQR